MTQIQTNESPERETGERNATSLDEEMERNAMIETIEELERERDALKADALRNFRWAYQLLLALAKRRLKDANAENNAKGEPDTWPAGQEWHEMVGSSHSIFLRAARAEAGIPEDAFMGLIRSLEYDVDDLYEAAALGEDK